MTDSVSKATMGVEKRDDSPLVEFLYPVLLSCELDRNFPTEETQSEDKPKRFYNCAIRPVIAADETYLALCELSAGEELKDLKLFNFVSSYVVGFKSGKKPPDDAIRAMMEQLAICSVWPLFRSSFAHMVGQATEDLPPLPTDPTVKWLSDDDEGSAA